MPVYPSKYVGLNAFERANAMAGLPIGFEALPQQKQIAVTLGGSNIGTGQTTVEGARNYLAGIPSGITGRGPRFDPLEIDAALKGITGAFLTDADAEAALRGRMTAFTPQELIAEQTGDYRHMLGQKRTGGTDFSIDSGTPTADDPFTALMNMLSGGGMNLGGSNITGVGSGGSVPINAPTIRSGQTNFTMDANGLRVTVPGKPAIRIPINTAGAGGTGIYRDAIAAALRNAGVQEADIQTVLADYALTREGQNESAPTAQADAVTASLADLFGTQTTGDATGGAAAGNTQLDQFLQLFGLGGDTTTQTADATIPDPAAGGDIWSNLFGAIKGGDADAEAGQFGGMLDFLNMGDEATAGFADMTEADWKQIAANIWNDPTSQMAVEQLGPLLSGLEANMGGNADIIGSALGNLFADPEDKESKDLLKELFGEEFTFEGIADAFASDPQMAMIMAGQLGSQNLDLFTTLIKEAENTRKFDQAMRQFTEGIKVEKQGQQITVLNKMMDITLGQMQLNEQSKANLMDAQIAGMNTALKSQELSQAEAASIRSNMLDAVGLELEEKRINNEQANFLSTQLLSQAELALRVRDLDQRGEIAAADRELEREGMALTERMGLADITAGILGRQAELQFGREGLAQERELGFAGIDQRREEAAMGAQVALLNAAMQNPYSFAALNTLGGIPGMAGGAAPAAAAVSPTGMFPSLAGLGFQVPETAQAGTRTPAPAFFSGGMPTVGALGELDPASLAFLQNVLAFSGTPPEGLGRMAGAVTPAAGGYPGLGRTFFG